MHAQQSRIVLKQTTDGESIEKRDSSLPGGFIGPCGVELVSGPECGFPRQLIEVHRLGATGEVVIPQQSEGALLLNDIDARQRIRTVPDDVTQADDLIDGAGFDFRHHRTEGDGIRMNVTDDGDAH